MSAEEAAFHYAVLVGEVVDNVVLASPEFAATQHGYVLIETVTPRPGPGWTRTRGGWQPAASPPGPHSQLHPDS